MAFFHALLSFFFPPSCIGCGQEGYILCPNCCTAIPIKIQEKSFALLPISTVFVLTDYTNPLVAKALKKFKFRFARCVLQDLEPFFERALSTFEVPANAIFVPVPLHFFRKAERGFNQSELIARVFSKLLKVSPRVISLLKRVRVTAQQARLHKAEREVNVRDAFQVIPKISRQVSCSTPLFLIDDVATTGSTLLECAKALQNSGYTDIRAIVIARG